MTTAFFFNRRGLKWTKTSEALPISVELPCFESWNRQQYGTDATDGLAKMSCFIVFCLFVCLETFAE